MSAPRLRVRWLAWLVACTASCEAPRHATPQPVSPASVDGETPPEHGIDGDAPRLEFPAREAAAPPQERELVEAELPDGWDTAPPAAFESLLAEVRAPGTAFAWSPAARRALVRALGREDRSAVHAAVLFAHARDRSSTEALLSRLEVLHDASARSLDAGDVVAAAALETLPLDADQLARMTALVLGPEFHPDLEVRVEIARSALARGEDAVIPFLVRVLRALTPAEIEDPPDWERITTLAWAKSRAAEALAARAGESESRFRPDASWEDQMREADRLEALLAR